MVIGYQIWADFEFGTSIVFEFGTTYGSRQVNEWFDSIQAQCPEANLRLRVMPELDYPVDYGDFLPDEGDVVAKVGRCLALQAAEKLPDNWDSHPSMRDKNVRRAFSRWQRRVGTAEPDEGWLTAAFAAGWEAHQNCVEALA